jgi:Helix-turn-helix domain
MGCNQMDERLKFIARLLDGEMMAVPCRQFGISRKTGDKILTRYNETGLNGLTDRSRQPYGNADTALTASPNLPLHTTGRFCCQADRQDEGVRKDGHDRLDAISIVTFPSHLTPKNGLRENESPYHIHDDMRSNLQFFVDRGLPLHGG